VQGLRSVLTQPGDSYINTQSQSYQAKDYVDEIKTLKERNERNAEQKTEKPEVKQIAYRHGNATNSGQTGAPLTVNRKADNLADSIAGASSQQQVKIIKTQSIGYPCPDNTADDTHANPSPHGPQVISNRNVIGR